MEDHILIEGLDLPVQIGVPDEERADWQNLMAHVWVYPQKNWVHVKDVLEETIDYVALSLALKREAAKKSRKLIEVLANDLCLMLLRDFPIKKVTLELRKFIVPGTRAVAVKIERTRSHLD